MKACRLPELISDLGFQISDLLTQIYALCKSGFHGREIKNSKNPLFIRLAGKQG